ncbi:segregation and condensation protein A [Propioniciclava flava]|uniref:Segregation and condensation protein A n=1 Tax=Propioniciclava flava TaxID=2072026 RepID=A0A4Q2ELZ5_9ACTN|nr:segregation/condensation protein A [Propioniciclava flava]RXW33624.1 segregation/condensation protein A [Propioniciclava flava]
MTQAEPSGEFTVKLTNFEGPFDLLLQLISRHKLDVTEVALSAVTDEFIAHLRAMGNQWDLDQTSSFLVVAATLLDLKAARLLPAGEVEDADDIAMLEARDLLFARLLQYRAFKQVSGQFRDRLDSEARRFPRPGGLEEAFARLLPEVVLTVEGDHLAWLAAAALQPKTEDAISLAHLHAPAVSVREQADLIVARLRESGSMTFRALVADAGERLVVVARFLALLELARQRVVSFDQVAPLGALTIRWTAPEAVGFEPARIDEFTGVPPQGDPHA